MYCGFVYDKGNVANARLQTVVFDIGKMDPQKHTPALIAALDRDVESGVLYRHHGVHYSGTRRGVERKTRDDIEWEIRM
ncbi:MAG: hypothetical protein AABX14_01400 [Candidatus Aenigmatarchaeota archaeon]